MTTKIPEGYREHSGKVGHVFEYDRISQRYAVLVHGEHSNTELHLTRKQVAAGSKALRQERAAILKK